MACQQGPRRDGAPGGEMADDSHSVHHNMNAQTSGGYGGPADSEDRSGHLLCPGRASPPCADPLQRSEEVWEEFPPCEEIWEEFSPPCEEIWEEFSRSFTPAVREVVGLARMIPGFQDLSQHDQVTLLKAGTFEVLMVRFASLFDVAARTVTFLSGRSYSVAALRGGGAGRGGGASRLLASLCDFSERLASLGLDQEERSLFTAVVLVSADRSGVQDVSSVEALQDSLIRALRALLMRNRGNDRAAAATFTRLLLRLPELRSLNNLHSEELLTFNP